MDFLKFVPPPPYILKRAGHLVKWNILFCFTCNTAAKEPEWSAHPESDDQTWKTWRDLYKICIKVFTRAFGCHKSLHNSLLLILMSQQMLMVLTPVRCPDAAEKSDCRISRTFHSDVCPCCLWMKSILVLKGASLDFQARASGLYIWMCKSFMLTKSFGNWSSKLSQPHTSSGCNVILWGNRNHLYPKCFFFASWNLRFFFYSEVSANIKERIWQR